MSTILLVEDDEPTRERLAAAISAHQDLSLVATAGTLAGGLAAFQAYQPRVVLTDLGLPDGSGLELIKAVYESNGSSESMVITVFGDEQHVVGALRAGARGYLLKDSSVESVGAEIHLLLDGGSPINPKVARYLLKLLHDVPAEADVDSGIGVTLSSREEEILSLIARGFKRSEIAGKLDITANTVSTYIKRVYEKLSVHSNVEAVREATRLGLLDATP